MASLGMQATALRLRARRALPGRRAQSRSALSPARRWVHGLKAEKVAIRDRSVWRIRQPGQPPSRTVIYLPGGAYVQPMLPLHWRLICRLARRLPSTAVVVPLYGLAPECTHRDAWPFLTDVHQWIARDAGIQSIGIVGDSAGGALALRLTQRLIGAGASPDALALISPWTHAQLEAETVEAFQSRDPMLDAEELRLSVTSWAGGDTLLDPDISPGLGPLMDLPPTLVFAGDRDLLYTGTIRFYRDAISAGSPVTLEHLPGGLHDYPLFRCREGRAARAVLERFLDAELGGLGSPTST